MNCPVCGNEVSEADMFCSKCGAAVSKEAAGFIMVTTPTIQGYRIKKVLGVVTGLTPRTRGFLGQFVGGIQSMFGGEITAFTSELEKARMEAIERVKAKAMAIGANAILGLDLETSDMGFQTPVVVISATGTAVIVEPE
ncbi:MAG: heavy metal-binding domain-containing protein [Candidatus Bathyarchaeia archaeon]